MNLFSQIEALPMIGEWCTPEKARTLASIVLTLRPEVVVEIGVWKGSSLLPMALALKEIGKGMVVGIDPYSAQVSVQGQNDPAHAQFWGQTAPHEAVFTEFMGRLDQYQLHEHVRLVRKPSNDVVPPEMGLLHVDGNHSDQAVQDVIRYAPKVKQGGFVVMDDLDWSGGGVTTAAGRLLSFGFVQLYRVKRERDDWAVYQRLGR